MAGLVLADSRTGKNIRHTQTAQVGQSVSEPVVVWCRGRTKRRFFRADPAFRLFRNSAIQTSIMTRRAGYLGNVG